MRHVLYPSYVSGYRAVPMLLYRTCSEHIRYIKLINQIYSLNQIKKYDTSIELTCQKIGNIEQYK